MPVYRPRDKTGKQAAEYIYDFRLDGHRFSGRTGCTSRGGAREAERRRRDEAKAQLDEAARRKAAPMTIDVAAARFRNETGQFYRGGAGKTFDAALAWIVTQLGKSTLVSEITNSRVAELVARRRGQTFGKDKRAVAPATVNRTVTEPLRRVLRRAEQAWDQAVQPIRWREHMLAEPRERVRSLTDDEETKLLAAVPADYRPVVAFALRTGFRLAECVNLRWIDIDFGGRRIAVKGKGGKVASIPLTPAVREILWPLKGHHDEFVFTYLVTVPRAGERRRGERHPITYEGMKSAWRRAKGAVPNFRFHDTRHTAATRLLRSSGNLKLVQKLLRHDEIATTAKYAHAHDDDLREAMEAVERHEKRQNNDAEKVTSEAKTAT